MSKKQNVLLQKKGYTPGEFMLTGLCFCVLFLTMPKRNLLTVALAQETDLPAACAMKHHLPFIKAGVFQPCLLQHFSSLSFSNLLTLFKKLVYESSYFCTVAVPQSLNS